MNKLEVKRHSFNLAKDRLKDFSETTAAELKIDDVSVEGGFLWMGDHKVTGKELNERIETIQNHLITINNTNNKVIKEFREVYNALDVLDKDYITSIIANIKAIEKTSNDVRKQQEILKKHNDMLAGQQRKLDVHQTEIEKNIANVSKIVTALKVFKEKLEGYEHLTDIDKIWNNCMSLQNDIQVRLQKIDDIRDEVDTIVEIVDSLDQDMKEKNRHIQDLENTLNILVAENDNCKKNIGTLMKNLDIVENYAMDSKTMLMELDEFRKKLSENDHLLEVDDIWKRTEMNQQHINAIEQEFVSHLQELETLIQEINKIWREVEEQASSLVEIEGKNRRNEALIEKNKEEIDKKIADTAHTFSTSVDTLEKKIKYAYWIAGTSMGVAGIELILILLKVI